VKDNPLPVTLVGVGLAWLMAADRGSRRGAGASSAAESARSYLQGASGAMDAGKQKLGDTTRAARERLEQARGSYERIANEQPLALGAIGLAIGAVLAASLPRTRMEEKAGDALGDSLNAGQPERAAAEATRTTGSNRAAPEGPLSAPMPAPAVETRPVPREPAPEAKPSAPTAGRPATSPR
jgi:hypothetical protein